MARKKRLIISLLSLLVFAVFLLPTVISYATESDSERDGLSGSVQSVVWRATGVTRYSQNGLLTESDGYDVEKVEYDKAGNRMRRRRYGMCDACAPHLWLSDFKGRVRIETFLASTLTLLVHSYDGRGNRVETKTYYGGFGNLRRWIYKYELDERGNWTKKTSFMIDAKFNGDSTPVPREIDYREISYH